MNVLLVGLGSIGQRHVRNLRHLLGAQVEISAFRTRKLPRVLTDGFGIEPGSDVEEKYAIRVFDDLDEALAQRPTIAFICNPSSLHLPAATAAARAGCHLFIEKPLSHSWDGVERFVDIVERSNLVALVGYQMRFHPCLQRLRALLQEKRIGAVLMGGQPIVSIDNLNGELRGDALCQMVERPIVQVRILGKSELMRIETRATLFATGNNIVVVGDMVRRTLLASMDANVERPELREFKQHPIEMVLADRGKYIAAVLTIVRAYQQAGYPNSLPTLASYNQWSLMVRSALVWLDRADPAETIEISRANDPELVSLNAVVTAWRIAVNVGETKTAGELVKLADAQENVPIKDENGNEVKDELGVVVTEFTYKHPDLRDALDMVARGRRGLDATLLGKWLSGQQNKVVGAVKIIKLGGGTHVRRWGLSTAI